MYKTRSSGAIRERTRPTHYHKCQAHWFNSISASISADGKRSLIMPLSADVDVIPGLSYPFTVFTRAWTETHKRKILQVPIPFVVMTSVRQQRSVCDLASFCGSRHSSSILATQRRKASSESGLTKQGWRGNGRAHSSGLETQMKETRIQSKKKKKNCERGDEYELLFWQCWMSDNIIWDMRASLRRPTLPLFILLQPCHISPSLLLNPTEQGTLLLLCS